jgi:ppGpp synthetase/RelA/SpoT-type nucleotidyltranferase
MLPARGSQPPEYLRRHFTPGVQEYVQYLHDHRTQFAQLIDEVTFLLSQKLSEANVEVAHIVGRQKSAESAVDKLYRKSYTHPITQITDVAGVRVVHLFPRDVSAIGQALHGCFAVVEHVPRIPANSDQFGYSAQHYVVRLKETMSGQRGRILKDLVCEVQVRTVLEDAWALMNHHLRYKREDALPLKMKRQLNALAAVMENSDQQFETIANNRAAYLKRLNNPRTKLRSLFADEANADTIAAYLRKKFPAMAFGVAPGHLYNVVEHLNHERYPTIGHLDKIIEMTADVRSKYQLADFAATALAQLALALACTDERYRERTVIGKEASELVREYCSMANLGTAPAG